MALSVKHKFQSAKGDGGDTSLVRPSNWNDEHDIVMSTGKVLGRTTAGSGGVEELAAGTFGLNKLADTDSDFYQVDATSGAATHSLPQLSTVYNGYERTIKKIDESANKVTVDGYGSETIDDAATLDLSAKNSSVTLKADVDNGKWKIVSRVGASLAELGITASPIVPVFDEPAYITVPTVKTYKLVVDRKFAGTIQQLTAQLEAGTATLQFKNAGSNVGAAINATTGKTSVTVATGGAFVAGDDWTLVVSAVSGAVGLSFNAKYTRTIG